ncbi:MAG TPA: hypothetical protein VGF45_03160 [Polyangia bacterium]
MKPDDEASAAPLVPKGDANPASVDLGPLVYARADASVQLPSQYRARFSEVFGLAFGAPLAILGMEGDPLLFFPAAAAIGLAIAGHVDEPMRQRYRLRRTPLATREELARGWGNEPRRVIGIVETDERSFRDVVTGGDAVFVRTLYFESDGQGGVPTAPGLREDVRGVRFRVRLGDGASFLIEPASLRVLTPIRVAAAVPEVVRRALRAPIKTWRRAFLRIYQQRICPGDTVEIAGRVEADVSPRASAAPGRGVPVLHTFVGAAGHEVPLRVITAADQGR